MALVGIIVEYDPLHLGHQYLMDQVRRQLGEETSIVCCMSGDFTQRGDFAIVGRYARARAAVESGADLVVELPLPWAVSSAEGFARGGVETLGALGCTHLAFGSEVGEAASLMEVARCLRSPAFSQALRRELTVGDSFPAARERAVAALLGRKQAALLSQPNNILGVEYCKAMLDLGLSMEVLTIRRRGPGHNEEGTQGGFASASAIRSMLRAGEDACHLMAPAMARLYKAEAAQGRAPVFAKAAERAILGQLRRMTASDFAAIVGGNEGLSNRLYEAVRTSATVEEILERAKTKRYPYARLRRSLLRAYLGVGDVPAHVPYLRPLAMNRQGARALRQAALPVLSRSGDVRALGEEAQRLFTLEVLGADLYGLACPALGAGDALWRQGVVMVPGERSVL